MDDGLAGPETIAAVRAAFARLANHVHAFNPELVIQFAPDHFNGFFYDMMPAFCIGTAANSIGDWGTRAGPLPVPEEIARDLVMAVHAQDVDAAFSHRMVVDHGFTQIWEAMFGTSDLFPIVPIFVNAAAPPLPSYRRARMLGEAVGRYAAASGRRVLFAASGGLSHDPPVPQIIGASAELRERLIDGRNPTPDMRDARQSRVRAAGVAAARGEGPCAPLNVGWDRSVLHLFEQGDIKAFDDFDTDQVRQVAGRGANETLAWVAAFAAQSIAGPIAARIEFYEAIPAWIAGMAMMFGTTLR